MLQQCCSIPNNNNSNKQQQQQKQRLSIPAENEILFCILCRRLRSQKHKEAQDEKNAQWRQQAAGKPAKNMTTKGEAAAAAEEKKMKSKQNAFERVCSITMCVIAASRCGGRRCRKPPTQTHTQSLT